MQFALIENEKVTPAPGLHGHCPGCGSVTIAKCGKHRLWHWAHKGERSCDPWWETETQWHRTWKNYFQREWQEVIQHDVTGEKHIADVRTSHGMVVELQHSHMKPDERVARETFYRNMVWVVDGTRLKTDRPRFEKAMSALIPTPLAGVFTVNNPKLLFPRMWLDAKVPVFFDFLGQPEDATVDLKQAVVWCLYPERADGAALVAVYHRSDLVGLATTGKLVMSAVPFAQLIAQRQRAAREAELRRLVAAQRASYRNQYGRGRRRL